LVGDEEVQRTESLEVLGQTGLAAEVLQIGAAAHGDVRTEIHEAV
jgi:ribosomal protein S28E/S33